VQKLDKFVAVSALAAGLVMTGCRQDMHNQPKFFPQRGTTLFADGRSVRPQVANTVARSQAVSESYFATGLVDGKEGDGLPFPVTTEVIARGQERYNVYCTPCHSRVGNGEGMAVQRGYTKAGNFHTARLRSAPLGHFFNVMTNGYGAMPDYASQIAPADRWAIAAYIRALQLSQNAQQADVPAGAHVASLKSIAETEGLPESFTVEQKLPGTAVTGTPSGESFVLPGPGGAGATTQSPAAKSTGTQAAPGTTGAQKQ